MQDHQHIWQPCKDAAGFEECAVLGCGAVRPTRRETTVLPDSRRPPFVGAYKPDPRPTPDDGDAT
jgi:hypothetical protein